MSEIRDRISRFFAAADKLYSFESPSAVHAFLVDLNYKGRKGQSGWCPVARWVKDCVGDPDGSVRVNGYDVTYEWQDGATGKRSTVTSSTPKPVASFIHAFDIGEYPELASELVPA